MAEQFSEKVEILDSASNVTIWFNGNSGAIIAGGNGDDGDLILKDGAETQRIWMDGGTGNILIKNAAGQFILRVDGTEGDITVYRNNRPVMSFDASQSALYIGCEDNEGDLYIRDGSGRTVFTFDSNTAALYIGANGNEGDLQIRDGSGRAVFNFDSNAAAQFIGANGNDGNLYIRDGSGRTVFGFNSNAGALRIGANGNEGDLQIRDGSGQTVFNFNSANAMALSIRDGSGRQVLGFNSNAAGLVIGAKGNEGGLVIRDGSGRQVLGFIGDSAGLHIGANGNGGRLCILDGSGRHVFNFDSEQAGLGIGSKDNVGDITVRGSGNASVKIYGETPEILLSEASGDWTIHLNGDTGDIRLRNADAAEHFDVADEVTVEPGMIMALDEDGKLKPSSTPYDKKVVGVTAGAGDHRPGIIMDERDDNDKRVPISVLGKVSCRADATDTPIDIGDLLTTSSTPGHAMKADDRVMAFGAVIGKALGSLRGGKGLIPILVALQ